MISDRELDARLTAARGVDDAGLPALPPSFLDVLRAEEPASVIAARQLVDDARTAPRTRRRRAAVRLGVAAVALAAAWTTAVVVAPADRAPAPDRPAPSAPAPGIELVAAEEVTFPFSLDPAPPGLTPAFSMRGGMAAHGGGPVVYVGDWSSDDGRVLADLFPADPRTLPEQGWSELGDPAGTVTVDGVPAEVRTDDGLVTLLWERPDGRWMWLLGEGSYGELAALTAVAESVVDRPQPVGLQFGLAPAGWSVGGYEASRSLDLVNDADPMQTLRVSLYGGPGYPATIDSHHEGTPLASPVEPVTIQGRPGRLALADGGGSAPDSWFVTGELPGGVYFLLLAPQVLTRDQVLQIAEQVTATP
ncbi:hypothetical protein [Blastococcus sp. SYSU D00820]